jgi:NADPH:quinone reductase-like Zn-dependent oxidoreductase
MGPWAQSLLAWLGARIVRSKRVVIPLPQRSSVSQFLTELRDRMVAGRYRAIIDRTYRLDQIADAYRYVETGQKAGIVVILVASV